jgi:hypothetical protein
LTAATTGTAFAQSELPEDALARALMDTVCVLREGRVPYVLIGGAARRM